VEARFSAPVQIGPEAQTASYIMGTWSFPGVKRPGRGVDYQPHLPPRIKKVYRYTSAPTLDLLRLFYGELPCKVIFKLIPDKLSQKLFLASFSVRTKY